MEYINQLVLSLLPFIWTAIFLACIVSIIVEYFIKKLIALPAAKINLTVCIVSFIVTFIYVIIQLLLKAIILNAITIISFLGVAFTVALLAMNLYDKLLVYAYHYISSLFKSSMEK